MSEDRSGPHDDSSIWPRYYDAVSGREPRDLLRRLITLLDERGIAGRGRQAIDLGCGDGTDAIALLGQGFDVLAVDGHEEAIARLRARLPLASAIRLETQVASFETMALRPADIIFASLSLPFCRPAAFPWVWLKIAGLLRPGGWFAGHFFGVRDSWATRSEMTFHTAGQLRALLAPFTIEFFSEEERDGSTALGEAKHWHLFSVIAEKRVESRKE